MSEPTEEIITTDNGKYTLRIRTQPSADSTLPIVTCLLDADGKGPTDVLMTFARDLARAREATKTEYARPSVVPIMIDFMVKIPSGADPKKVASDLWTALTGFHRRDVAGEEFSARFDTRMELVMAGPAVNDAATETPLARLVGCKHAQQIVLSDAPGTRFRAACMECGALHAARDLSWVRPINVEALAV